MTPKELSELRQNEIKKYGCTLYDTSGNWIDPESEEGKKMINTFQNTSPLTREQLGDITNDL